MDELAAWLFLLLALFGLFTTVAVLVSAFTPRQRYHSHKCGEPF